MRGITNAPQGSGGGSGGEWIKFTNSDWSDLFEVNNSIVTAKKNIIITLNQTMEHVFGTTYIPKGFTASNSDGIEINAYGTKDPSDSSLYIVETGYIDFNTIPTGGSVKITCRKHTFNVNFANQTFNIQNTSSDTQVTKSWLYIWYQD